MRESVAEGDARRGCLDGVGGIPTFKHARLGGHGGFRFYMRAKPKRSCEVNLEKLEIRAPAQIKPRGESRVSVFLVWQLLLGSCVFRGGIGVLLGKALDATGGVHKLLLSGEKRMAVGAD